MAVMCIGSHYRLMWINAVNFYACKVQMRIRAFYWGSKSFLYSPGKPEKWEKKFHTNNITVSKYNIFSLGRTGKHFWQYVLCKVNVNEKLLDIFYWFLYHVAVIKLQAVWQCNNVLNPLCVAP